MIKTLIFDNNGVLTTHTSLKRVCFYLKVSEDKLMPILLQEFEAIDVGKIRVVDFYKRLFKKYNCENLEAFLKENINNFKPILPLYNFVAKVSKKYEVVMLTNFGDFFDDYNKRSWKLDKLFPKDKIFVSSKLGMRKPSKDIYLHTLNKLKRKPDEVVFIDDTKANIMTARSLGINAVLFQSLEKLKQDLKKYIRI